MTEVRRGEPGDADQLLELANEVSAEEGRWLLAVDRGRTPGDERRYLKSVRRHPDAAVFVAVEDGTVVGRLSLSRDPHPASRHVADLGLMVAFDHRRQGIGRMLLEHAVGWARASGILKLELHVFTHNDPALRLYEAFGFEREGLRRAHYERDGTYLDVILMAYAVPTAPTPA